MSARGTAASVLDIGRDRFRELVGEDTTDDTPVVIRVGATLDVDSVPLSAYAALTTAAETDHAFLLESAEKTPSSDPGDAFGPSPDAVDRHARFSFVGYDPAAVITVGPDGTDLSVLGDDRYDDLLDADVEGDVLDSLRGALPDARLAGFEGGDRRRLDGGLVGFLAYDAVYDLHLHEIGLERPDSRLPDAQYVLSTRTLAFDEVADTIELVFTPVLAPEDDPDAVYDDLLAEAERVGDLLESADDPVPGGFQRTRETAGPRDEYEEAVRRAKEHVRDGDVYQCVLSRTRELYGEVDPLGLYAALRDLNPSPYMYLLEYGDRSIVGASPETLVSVRDDEVTVNPIAGTCPRGAGPVEDRRLAGEMLADEKERSEHTMLVDLARNDARQVAEPGSIRVQEFMNVLKYSHVQHIESTVTATLREDRDAFDATRATFPAGTLSGAPKMRAMELIDELELAPRGVYGGGVGYFSWTGDADAAIVIRTATVEDLDGEQRISVQAGAGLVADSDPAAEYEETEAKMGGVLAALERIETGERSGDEQGRTSDERETDSGGDR